MAMVMGATTHGRCADFFYQILIDQRREQTFKRPANGTGQCPSGSGLKTQDKGAVFPQSGADPQAAILVSGADCTDTKAAILVAGADCTDTTTAISVAGAATAIARRFFQLTAACSQWWLMKGTCGDMLLRHIEGTSGYRKIDAPRNWKF